MFRFACFVVELLLKVVFLLVDAAFWLMDATQPLVDFVRPRREPERQCPYATTGEHSPECIAQRAQAELTLKSLFNALRRMENPSARTDPDRRDS